MSEERNELLERYRKVVADPWEFLSTCVFTMDQVDAETPVKAFPTHLVYLKLYVRIWEKQKKLLIPKSRRMVMSWTNIALFLWDTLFHEGRFNAIVSKKEEDADELIQRAKFIYEHIPESIIPRDLLPAAKYKYCALEFAQIGSKLQGFPQGADQLRQFTFSGILADEMAFWEYARKMYSSAFPTLEGGGRFTGVSSPAPGFFKQLVFDKLDDTVVAKPKKHFPMTGVELWTNVKNDFTIFQLHYSADPKKRDKAYRKYIKNSMPLAQYLQEYELQWDSFEGKPVYRDWNKQQHASKDMPQAEFGLPLLRGWDFGLCYDDQTEVLTDNGWKLFKDVDIKTDRVMSLDPDTFKCDYVEAKLKVDLPYNGTMYKCEGQNLNLCVTADHIVPYWTESGVFQRKYAKDILTAPGHSKLRMTGKWSGKDYANEFDLSPKLFASFMGAYLSEGSVSSAGRISIYQNNSNMTWVEEITKATELSWTKGDNVIRVTNHKWAAYLRDFGKAPCKYVPDEIKFGTPEVIQMFIDAYTKGDGHIRVRLNKSEEHTIFSSSKRMIDDLQDLALKMGWYSSVVKVGPTESYYAQEDRVIKSSGGWNIRFKKCNDFIELRSYEYEEIHYEGKVYCLSVPSGILYVRRNGRPHWNGNTPACVIAQLQGKRLVVLHEFIGDRGIDIFSREVLAQCAVLWPEWASQRDDWRDFIDPSGNFRKDTDESTCAKIMVANGIKRIIPGAVTWEERRTAVEYFLITYEKGEALLQVSLEACPVLVRGFEGGYRYSDKVNDIEPLKVRPLKDEHSHVHDAFQYLCSRIASVKRKSNGRHVPSPGYSWMKGKGDLKIPKTLAG